MWLFELVIFLIPRWARILFLVCAPLAAYFLARNAFS